VYHWHLETRQSSKNFFEKLSRVFKYSNGFKGLDVCHPLFLAHRYLSRSKRHPFAHGFPTVYQALSLVPFSLVFQRPSV
jgi:hypothetical protein